MNAWFVIFLIGLFNKKVKKHIFFAFTRILEGIQNGALYKNRTYMVLKTVDLVSLRLNIKVVLGFRLGFGLALGLRLGLIFESKFDLFTNRMNHRLIKNSIPYSIH